MHGASRFFFNIPKISAQPRADLILVGFSVHQFFRANHTGPFYILPQPSDGGDYAVLRFTFPYHVSRCRHGWHIGGALVSSFPGIVSIGNGLAVTNCTVTASLWQPCHVACIKRVTCIRVSSWIIVTCGDNNLSQGMFRVDFNKVFKGNDSFKK